jgi:biopolymer transport protein ExbD
MVLPENPNIVSISATTGVVRISDGVEMALPLVEAGELIPYLKSRPEGTRSKPVVIHADRSTRYDRIDEVLAALKLAGVREVYFFTDLPEPTNA